jgi:hypothetical protein
MRCEHGDVVGVGYQGCSQGTWLYTTLHSAVLRGTMRYYPSRNKSLASNECPMGYFPFLLCQNGMNRFFWVGGGWYRRGPLRQTTPGTISGASYLIPRKTSSVAERTASLQSVPCKR